MPIEICFNRLMNALVANQIGDNSDRWGSVLISFWFELYNLRLVTEDTQ